MFIVTATDYGETCDGHTRLLGRYPDKDKAAKFVGEDMASYHDNLVGNGIGVEKFDLAKREVWAVVGQSGCVWDIFDLDSLPPLDNVSAI